MTLAAVIELSGALVGALVGGRWEYVAGGGDEPLDAMLGILMGAMFWPVLIILAIVTRPTRAERRAQQRARLAEVEAAEAKAISERLTALGIEP